jgi:hypothetical protein
MQITSLNTLIGQKESFSPLVAECIAKTAVWITDYIAKSNINLPHKSSICPAVKKSMALDSIHFHLMEDDRPSKETLKNATLELENFFFELPPNDGLNDIYKVVGVLIASDEIEGLTNTINEVQKELKPYYITKGLLLGKFHSLLKTTSINNPNFIPGRSPFPMIVLRYLVEEDKYFLSYSNADAQTKSLLLKSYLEHMSNKISDESISFVNDQIDKLTNDDK